jgi:hypothetical protein
MSLYIYIYSCISLYIFVYKMYVCIYIYIYTHIYLCVYMCIHIHVHAYIIYILCIYIRVNIICIYVYVYISCMHIWRYRRCLPCLWQSFLVKCCAVAADVTPALVLLASCVVCQSLFVGPHFAFVR